MVGGEIRKMSVGVEEVEGKSEMRARDSDTNGLHWDKGSWEGDKGCEIKKHAQKKHRRADRHSRGMRKQGQLNELKQCEIGFATEQSKRPWMHL